MKAETMIGLVATIAMSAAFAAEPAKPAPMDGKDMMEQCAGMKADGKPGGDQGKGMGCPKEGMSDEHMIQMHDHMKDMHGDGGMMGKGGMGAMPADAAGPAKAAPGKKDKSAAAAPADAVDHSAHHPK